MHRRALIELLQRHAAQPGADAVLVRRFVSFVQGHADCLLRTCAPGHVTASAWILSADGRSRLLTHHKKLDRWLQLGGHVDGEPEVHRAALREAAEESGMVRLQLLGPGGRLLPLDLDVHPIPARPGEPAHEHWDVRFLLRALPGQPLRRAPAESRALRWVPGDSVGRFTDEESVLRLEARAARWLEEGVAEVPGGQVAEG